jgi:hypothetical protein
VPALIPAVGLPVAQAAAQHCESGSRSAEGAQKELQALMVDEAVDLWATDEVHFQQHGSRCQMWIPPETKDPVLLHSPTRHGVGYFAAVRLRDGKFVSVRPIHLLLQ